MLRITTPTRIIENWDIYLYKPVKYKFSDEYADEFMGYYANAKGEFITRLKGGAPKAKVDVSIHVEKPRLQITNEITSPEKMQAAKDKDKTEELAIIVKRSRIDLTKEMEVWLKTIYSADSRRGYCSRITNHFLKYCKEHSIDPVMLMGEDVRVFVNYLNENGKSVSLIKAVIGACKKLFMTLWENHGVPIQTNPFGVTIPLLRKPKREKELLVPDQIDVDNILNYCIAEKNMIVYAALKFIAKQGARIGAFEKMRIFGTKAVTESKGRTVFFKLDDEDVTLSENYSLNEFTAAQLGGRVNYLLEQAYKKGVTKHKYSAHDFRHFFAVKIFKETGSIREVSRSFKEVTS